MKISLFVLKCISATLRNTTRRRAKCVWQQCYKFLSTYDDWGAPITTNLQRTIQGNLYSHLLSLPPIQNSFFFSSKKCFNQKCVCVTKHIHSHIPYTHAHRHVTTLLSDLLRFCKDKRSMHWIKKKTSKKTVSSNTKKMDSTSCCRCVPF